jgi:hypothetical protein
MLEYVQGFANSAYDCVIGRYSSNSVRVQTATQNTTPTLTTWPMAAINER